MLTGSVPFRGDTAVATLLMHIEKAPPLDEGRGLPAPMLPVLRRSLAKDPESRYASAHEMADALRRTGEPPAVATSRRRAAALIIFTAAAALVAALAIGLRWWTVSDTKLPKETPSPGSVERLRVEEPSAAPSPAEPVPLKSTAPRTRQAPAPAPSLTPSPPQEPVPSTPPSTTPPTTLPETTPQTLLAPGREAREAEKGFLAVTAIPWADVRVDGDLLGQTPLRVSLSAGSHAVLLTHPDYEPFPRRVRIPADGTFRLVLNWPTQGVRRHR
jgi:hypothetical protein